MAPNLSMYFCQKIEPLVLDILANVSSAQALWPGQSCGVTSSASMWRAAHLIASRSEHSLPSKVALIIRNRG